MTLGACRASEKRWLQEAIRSFNGDVVSSAGRYSNVGYAGRFVTDDSHLA